MLIFTHSLHVIYTYVAFVFENLVKIGLDCHLETKYNSYTSDYFVYDRKKLFNIVTYDTNILQPSFDI